MIVDFVSRFIEETRGHPLDVTVPEAELLHDFATWVDSQSAQQSVWEEYPEQKPIFMDEKYIVWDATQENHFIATYNPALPWLNNITHFLPHPLPRQPNTTSLLGGKADLVETQP